MLSEAAVIRDPVCKGDLMAARHAFLCAAVLAFGGCAVDPERQAALDRAQCREYGMRPGTDAFATCRMTLDLERKRERRCRLDDLDGWRGYPPGYHGRW